MFTRTSEGARPARKHRSGWSAIGLLALLAACGRGADENRIAAADARQAADNGRIECALQGAADFARACTLDRIAADDELTLVVHNPDGGFHRLIVTHDGRGVAAADGAEQAQVTIAGPGMIEVAIGGDRYRLPATIKGRSPA